MDEPKGAKPKMASAKPKMAVLILGSLFVLAVIALITVAVTQNQWLPKNIKYGIVLDAGSSHTNLYVYAWPAEKENDTGVVQQVEVCKVEGPGISGYSQAVQNASRSLQHCLERAQEVVPQQQHQETPVYLGATAGMRLLSLDNRHVAMEVLSAVENKLRSSPFNFQGARIITGQEEGAYGWITINYLLGSFKQSGWLNFLPKLTSIKETVGALDLGGASTQITFVPEQEQSESQENSLHFRLYGKSYNVYTHSFLCYGKDQALRMKLVRDLQNAETGRLQDPCFHTGYERNVSIRDLYASPCTANYKQSLAFPQLHVVGSGDYQACQTRIEELFNKTSCPYSKCSFNGIFLPPLQGHFGAFSAFYFVMNFLNLSAESSPAPLNSAISTMKNFCSRPWSEIGSSDAGWTLGYMLNLTNMIPAEQSLMRPLSHAGYVGLMVLSSLVLVGALLLGWCIFRKPRCLRKGIV